MGSQNTIGTSVDEIIGDIVSDGGLTYVVNPAEETIGELITVLETVDQAPDVRMLAAESALKNVMADFLVASTAADQIETGGLSVQILPEKPVNSLLITRDRVVSVLTPGAHAAGLSTDDEEFVSASWQYYEDVWEEASEFSLRTPPLSKILETLEAELGGETLADFEAVLASLETARGDNGGLDEVTISLLVAARNEQLLYDISKWGEDVGLASKATFSRTKTQLEDRGLLDTEKVPIDVGRPRLRLLLGTEELREAASDELADVALKSLQ